MDMSQEEIYPEISIIIPAFNEEKGISDVIKKVKDIMDDSSRDYEIVVVDDGSNDSTVKKAEDSGSRVISHPYNIGNGAAIKTGIRNAKGKILVMLDGDGQHDPEDIPKLLKKIGPYDMVVGARTKKSEASFHRRLANIIYNLFATFMCGFKIEDLTSGFRAIKAEVAGRLVYLLPNTFSYPTTITLSVLRSGYSLGYIPINAKKRVGKSKIKLLRDGSRFFFIIIRIATLFSPMRIFLPVSMLMFFSGLGYGLYRIFIEGTRYGPTSAMLMVMAVVIFMVGLVSEQVAQLRFDRADLYWNEPNIDKNNHEKTGSAA